MTDVFGKNRYHFIYFGYYGISRRLIFAMAVINKAWPKRK